MVRNDCCRPVGRFVLICSPQTAQSEEKQVKYIKRIDLHSKHHIPESYSKLIHSYY